MRKPGSRAATVALDGAKIVRLRRQEGLTQKSVAKAAGLSPAYVSLIERGQVGRVSPSAAHGIAAALATTTKDITASDEHDPLRMSEDASYVSRRIQFLEEELAALKEIMQRQLDAQDQVSEAMSMALAAERTYLVRGRLPPPGTLVLTVTGNDRISFLRDVTGILADNHVDILEIQSTAEESHANLKILIERLSLDSMNRITGQLERLDGVVQVTVNQIEGRSRSHKSSIAGA